jgi:hypothetical protein
MGAGLGTWGFICRLMFFWLLEISLGYLWAALSGLFLNFFSHENGSSAMFIALGLSGFVQSLLLCFTLCAAKFTGLVCLSALAVVITFVFRFGFAVVNTARASQVGLNKALGALCFVLIPVGAAVCLFFGAIILLISLAV